MFSNINHVVCYDVTGVKIKSENISLIWENNNFACHPKKWLNVGDFLVGLGKNQIWCINGVNGDIIHVKKIDEVSRKKIHQDFYSNSFCSRDTESRN